MASYDFEGAVAFVTGAGRGQGRSHALHFAENGADVVGVDICDGDDSSPYALANDGELAETVERVEAQGRRALGVQADVSDAADVERAVERAVAEFGRIDVLVNNAGIAPPGGLLDLDEATWDRTLDVNLKGAWLCAKHVGAHMRTRGEGGRIVNTSSVAGMAGSIGLGHYAAAKHGVLGLTRTLALELAPHRITVNAVCPAAVDTPMTGGIVESLDADLADLADRSSPDTVLTDIVQPEDVSAAVMWLSSAGARYVTGITLPVDAGVTAI